MKQLAAGVMISLAGLGSAIAVQPLPDGDAPNFQNTASQDGQPSDAERRFRMMLMQRSMRFGGIFGGLIAPLNKPGAPQKSCGAYSDHAACSAYRNGDLWAADRLQQKRSTPSERDWYGR